ncbi:BCCT family transporter [Acidaminobacter hydrogenoformans]|uniref:Choline-glycine betaine transporter n=1 Tax=Acidaminobacter hydrogenoformans DSM 2784 TaxID=1120920 RepID=A0A1G5S493_9FIRM|nr:BCCT family transporter [Acidaminobacter hydrogenoformans]SCZ80359.1 Choline-glycine betaine transporter [Acidaminobacter hydrogenoformans DSM 2784]
MFKFTEKYRIGVIAAPVILFTTLIIIGLFNQELFISTLWGIFAYVMNNFGFTLNIGCLIFVLFLLGICFHPVSKIRFGGKEAKPELTRWNYWAIALCAGIGTGIMFYGAVEPLMHTYSVPQGIVAVPGSDEAIMFAITRSFYHWSITPYAIYAIAGLAISYAVYNMNKPFKVSSGLYPLLGERAMSPLVAGTVDALTLIAIVGGVSGALGAGIMQIGKGLQYTIGLQPSYTVWAVIAIVIIVSYTISSASGLNKGIKWLSDKNAWIFIGLLLIVIAFGPTKYISDLTLQGFGKFVDEFISISTFTSPRNTDMWPQWWDMYFLADWLAFGPIVGLFLARISYGRTIREFILINLILPAGFGIIWFGAFGGFVLDLQLTGVFDAYTFLNTEGMESIMLKIFEFLPMAALLRPIIILTIALSFVTLADSMTSSVALMSLKDGTGVKEAPLSIKVFWGVFIGLTAYIFILNGGIDGTKVVMALSGFPILIIEFLMMTGIIYKLIYKSDYDKSEFEKENVLSCNEVEKVG